MNPFTARKSRVSKRLAMSLMALALAVAAPAALASSTSTRQGVVHTYVQRSGMVVVTGYDGGAPLAPAH
jgi:hypothetical protein